MKRYDLELTATGPVMEEHEKGAFVPFSEVEKLQSKIYGLLEERNSTGLAIDKAIISGIVPNQHPIRSRLEMLANHHKRGQMLADGMVSMADRCKLLADLLRELRDGVEGEWCFQDNLDERIDAALVSKLLERQDTEWTNATQAPTAEDYRELQAQHDALQSKYKTAQNLVRDIVGFDREVEGDDGIGTMADRIDALLADRLPDSAVTVTETIRTAPERIWLQVGDQSHYHSEPFPSDTREVTWCADSVTECEVPYVREDLMGQVPKHEVKEWTNEQCIEFLCVAFRHCEINGDIEMDDIRLGVKLATSLAATSKPKTEQPGDKKPSLTEGVFAGLSAATALSGLDKESAADVAQLMLDAAEAKGGAPCAIVSPSSSKA